MSKEHYLNKEKKGGLDVIYDKVIEYCEKNKLSIAAFEKNCRIGNGTIGRWKNNSSLPAMSTLQKMEIATGVPIRKWIE